MISCYLEQQALHMATFCTVLRSHYIFFLYTLVQLLYLHGRGIRYVYHLSLTVKPAYIDVPQNYNVQCYKHHIHLFLTCSISKKTKTRVLVLSKKTKTRILVLASVSCTNFLPTPSKKQQNMKPGHWSSSLQNMQHVISEAHQ